MDKHLTVLGVLFLVLGVMGIVGMLIVLGIFFFGTALITLIPEANQDVPPFVALLPAVFGTFIALIIAVSAVPSLVAGYGLLQRRPWSRIAALIVGILNLPGIPFGTAVGVYAIWVFLQDETGKLLR
jgi:hypothetical protein